MKTVYLLIEHIMIDGVQHSLHQTPCFTNLETALRAKDCKTKKTGNPVTMSILQLMED